MLLALPVTVDGTWKGEIRAGGKNKSAEPAPATFDFKTDGVILTGKVTMSGGRRARSLEIREGKVDSAKISFVTVRTPKNGEQRIGEARLSV